MQIDDISIRGIESKAKKIAEKYNILFIIIYGSVAKGDIKEESDIDIALLGKKEISFNNLIAINNDFIDIFNNDKIDIKSLHNTNPLFRYEVTKDGMLLYGDKEDYIRYRIYAFRSFCESKKLFNIKKEQTKKQINNLLKK